MSGKVPFSFVLDYLPDPILKPMFGCVGVYVGGRIVLVLRKRTDHRSINGVWIATKKEHHESLRKLFPSMRSIDALGHGVTNWQLLGEKDEEFEASVLAVCQLIKKGDPRIGSIPKK